MLRQVPPAPRLHPLLVARVAVLHLRRPPRDAARGAPLAQPAAEVAHHAAEHRRRQREERLAWERRGAHGVGGRGLR